MLVLELCCCFFYLAKSSIKPYIYIVLYGCVCVCPWRLALQKEGWRQQMDGIRTVSSSCLLFRGPKNGAKNRPQKRELQYCRKKERLPKWRPRFWDQGVAYTVSPPLRAVSSGDSGTFRLFSLQRAWQSFIQVSHTHIYIYVFFSRSTPLFQPGLCHLRRDGEGLHQTQSPPGDRWTQSAANHRRAASDGAAKLPMRLGGGNGHGVIGQCLIFHSFSSRNHMPHEKIKKCQVSKGNGEKWRWS